MGLFRDLEFFELVLIVAVVLLFFHLWREKHLFDA
jgi:hypothetical protein